MNFPALKKWTLGVLVVLSVSLCLSSRADASDLKLTISADPKQPAGLILTLEDQRDVDIELVDDFEESTFTSWFTLNLTTDMGAPVTDLGAAAETPKSEQKSFVVLQRKEEKLILEINILRLMKSVSPGKYSLSVTYHNSFGSGDRVFHGSIDSNTIDFVVPDKADAVAAVSPFLMGRDMTDK